MTEKAMRHNDDKPRWSLLVMKTFEPLVRVFMYGATKYAPNNWKKGGKPQEEYLDCAQRHLAALIDGEKLDPESKQYHAAHVQGNMMMWIYFEQKAESDSVRVTAPSANWEQIQNRLEH